MSRIPDAELPSVPDLALGIYEHYKGMRYEVIAIALDTESLEPAVLYKPLYASKVPLWVRPYSSFMSSTEVDGERIARFKKDA